MTVSHHPRIIGISFGNVNAAVTIINKEGKPEIIANADGDRLTPSVVGFATGHEVAGTQALAQAIRSPQTTIREFKALLGQKASSETVKHHQQNFPVDIKNENDKPVYFISKSSMVMAQESEGDADGPKDITISPLTVTSHLLSHLKDTAEQYMGAKVDGCVITIPYAFTKEQRDDLLKAAQSAKLRVFQLVHEPVAALLANDADSSQSKTALVVDVGGYATTCTVVRVCDGIYDHVHHKTSFDVHSDLLTVLLRDHFAAEYEKKNGIALNKRALAKLHVAADTTKKMLSQTASGSCFVESLADGLDFQSTILRMKFEMMSRKAWSAWKDLVSETITGAKLSVKDIDEVLFVGGGSRIPKVVSSIKDVFASDDDDEDESSAAKPRFIVPQEPEVITSMGAGFQARHLSTLSSDAIEHYQSANVETLAVPSQISLLLSDAQKVALVDQGAPLPCYQRRKVQLQTSSSTLLTFKQEETLLAEIMVSSKEASDAGSSTVDVVFAIDANGEGHIAVFPENQKWQKTVTL